MTSEQSRPRLRTLEAEDPPHSNVVQFLNKEVYDYASKESVANAQQAVAQSMAQMIQNATLGFQNMEALTQAAAAIFMKKAAKAKNPAIAAMWLGVAGATAIPLETQNLLTGAVGKTAEDIVDNFGKSSPSQKGNGS